MATLAAPIEPFERWATAGRTRPATGLRPWETAAGAGSTLAVLALIASAADPFCKARRHDEIEDAYFPWIGSLHSLLDSLVDHEEDIAVDGRALVGYYASPRRCRHAHGPDRATRLCAGRWPCRKGGATRLIVAAMTSFYICELEGSASPHAQLVAPSVLDAIGGLATPSMAVLKRPPLTAPNFDRYSESRRFILKVKYLTFLFFCERAIGHHEQVTSRCPFGPVPPRGLARPARNAISGQAFAGGPSFLKHLLGLSAPSLPVGLSAPSLPVGPSAPSLPVE